MNEAAATDAAEFDTLFQIDQAATMAGGAIEDPWPVRVELLAKGPVQGHARRMHGPAAGA
jgi:hypothetical protein